MTTQSSPVITDMKVIPVAGHDSMLLNIGGAHSAYFTRNIVVLTDNAGHTGIGEAPGGEVIYQTLVDAIPMVLGQEVARLNKVVQQVHIGNQAADFDTFGKGAWTFELRVNAVAALEAALLDLLGKALNVPVCELLGPGKQRDAITVLGYLFYIGDRTKTDLPYLENTPGNHEWYQLRHQKAMNSEAVVRLAEASQDRYGFKDFKLKGGVLPGEQEIDTVRALKKRFPDVELFERKLEMHQGHLVKAAVELAKDWRTDRMLRKLEALLAVADETASLIITGNGDVVQPENDLIAIGSGGPYAQAAARALLENTELSAREIAEKALDIAGDICIYTNHFHTIEELSYKA